MRRKGLSFTMTAIVSTLVILATALLIMGIQGGFLSDTSDKLNQSTSDRFSDIELQQRRSQCEFQMDTFCNGEPVSDDVDCPDDVAGTEREWACKAMVDGIRCHKYWEGAYPSIPACGGGSGGGESGGSGTTTEETVRTGSGDVINITYTEVDGFARAGGSYSLGVTKDYMDVGTYYFESKYSPDSSSDLANQDYEPIQCGGSDSCSQPTIERTFDQAGYYAFRVTVDSESGTEDTIFFVRVKEEVSE